jgi:hypothetical protein
MSLLLAMLLAGSVHAVATGRVDDARAIARARHAFVIGEPQPFDTAYPAGVFVQRVAREKAEERVLREVFGVTPTPALVARECERIERTTRAPEQWQAIKAVLGQNRRRLEEALCRPLLVQRALQARFAFDPEIHAKTHARAREVRAQLIAGRLPAGAVRVVLSRHGTPEGSPRELLEKVRAEAAGPKVLRPPDGLANIPIAVHPEAVAALETQLSRPGDVSTVLAEWDRFTVYRLVEKTEDSWTVEAVTVPKQDFEPWFEDVAVRRPAKR